jgi:hypothetical protein
MTQTFNNGMTSYTMETLQDTDKSGILNETTMTLQKMETGVGKFQTPCGHLHHVSQENLRVVEIPTIVRKYETGKCGQCFEDGRGY